MSEHKTQFTNNDTIYGPVQSRRMGWSLGINLLGHEHKVCSYNCPYCELGESKLRLNQVGRTIKFHPPEVINDRFVKKLSDIQLSPHPIESICNSGYGEPTLYHPFKEVSEMIYHSRNEIMGNAKLHLLTNGAHFDQKKVLASLPYYDFIHVKFDAGDDQILKQINAPLVRTNINKILHQLRSIDHLILQSMFVTGSVDNTTNAAVESWMEAVGIVQPQVVHLYTLDRKPTDATILKVDEDILDIIGTKLRRKTQIEYHVFY